MDNNTESDLDLNRAMDKVIQWSATTASAQERVGFISKLFDTIPSDQLKKIASTCIPHARRRKLWMAANNPTNIRSILEEQVPASSVHEPVETPWWQKSEYKHFDGRKVDEKRVLVDKERGRTVKDWLPRRLDEGTRRGGPTENVKISGIEYEDRDRFSDDRREERHRRDRATDRAGSTDCDLSRHERPTHTTTRKMTCMYCKIECPFRNTHHGSREICKKKCGRDGCHNCFNKEKEERRRVEDPIGYNKRMEKMKNRRSSERLERVPRGRDKGRQSRRSRSRDPNVSPEENEQVKLRRRLRSRGKKRHIHDKKDRHRDRERSKVKSETIKEEDSNGDGNGIGPGVKIKEEPVDNYLSFCNFDYANENGYMKPEV